MERKWEHSKIEKYAEKWWLKNGYEFEIKKEWISKTVYIIRKDGQELEYNIYPAQKKYFNKEMETFQNYWNLYLECKRLRELVMGDGKC